ncbi:unnamed protein product [Protopolystoma xenopodis]|uniref:Uncharacterized protein n=1 Tax=Protopolystoma xenopodis TaxID=117903 RepID=A0A448WIJ3_9PLAT|nr:unnamed protein product [Protopolystoma xenopodis]
MVFKVILVGESAVGKSSLIERYCNDKLTSTYEPTHGISFKVKSIILDEALLVMQLWDVPGDLK